MGAQANAPIIIKRKKVSGGGGHHGGAWKVAYADFVTAMMAFFMLMWLLSATTEKQRKGIADYFSPTIPISAVSAGGDGLLGGSSIMMEDVLARDATADSKGAPEGGKEKGGDTPNEGVAEAAEVAALRDLEEVLLGRGGESILSEEALRHVVTRLTDDGLIIEVFALPDAPIFDADGARPTPVMEDLVAMLARVAGLVSNPVAVSGHVPARPVVVVDNPVWDLSSSRAAAVREMLEDAGLDPARLRRVTGHADRALAAADPMAVRNDRIEITLLRVQR